MESPGLHTSLSPYIKAFIPFSGLLPATSKELNERDDPSFILSQFLSLSFFAITRKGFLSQNIPTDPS